MRDQAQPGAKDWKHRITPNVGEERQEQGYRAEIVWASRRIDVHERPAVLGRQAEGFGQSHPTGIKEDRLQARLAQPKREVS